MALWPQFIGPSYRARSQAIAADRLVNLILEHTETDTEAKKATYYGTPGCKLMLTVATSGCRGGFSQDGRTFLVIGDTLYELNTALSVATVRGTIPNDGQPVSFASNGRGGEQLAICGGGVLKIFTFTTNVLSGVITLPLSNAPVQVDFIDGYFVLSEANTVRVWFSALENGTLWDALDFFAVSVASSNVVGIKVLRQRIWVFQSQSTVVYYDTGDADNPFAPYPSSLMQEGAVTPWAIAVLGESIYWLAQDNQGANRFVSASSYAPTVISTPPISVSLAADTTTASGEVIAYEQEGHAFLCWTFPSGLTWSYDTREQAWHERSTRNASSGQPGRWRARGICATGSAIVVGDFENGNLYTLDLDTFADNGALIERLRQAPYLSSENQWLFLDRFELGIQSGVGSVTTPLAPALAMLSISRDSGNTWTPPITATLGAFGAYGARCIWRKLGRTRADRLVVKVTMTDNVRCVWGPGAWLMARPGSGAL